MATLHSADSSSSVDGTFEQASFTNPTGLAIERSAHVLYVADGIAIRKVDLESRTVTTLAGGSNRGFADGQGGAAEFAWTHSLILVDGALLVSDEQNQRIRRVSLDGRVESIAGTGEAGYLDGPASSAKFNWPHGLFMNSAGQLFVSDVVNYRIRAVAPVSYAVSTVAGSGPVGTNGTDIFNSPSHPGKDGPGLSAVLSEPWSMTGDSDGNLWIGDRAAVRRLTPSGDLVTVAGDTVELGTADGAGNTARFGGTIAALAPDGAGNILIGAGSRLRNIDAAGNVTTLIGTGERGAVDGAAKNARFASIRAITVDSSTHLYVIDVDVAKTSLRELTFQ